MVTMAAVGFLEGIGRDLTGPGMFGGKFQIRLFLQPLLALLLGIRLGVRDAKQRRTPFFLSLFGGEGHGLSILKQGVRDAIVPLGVAFVVDGILQWMILGRVRLLAAVLVGALLVFLPFVLGRGVANRIWVHAHSRQLPHAP